VSWSAPEGGCGQVNYDRLILAAGSVNKLLPIPRVAHYTHGFRNVAEVIYLRDHVTRQLELAAIADSPAERQAGGEDQWVDGACGTPSRSSHRAYGDHAACLWSGPRQGSLPGHRLAGTAPLDTPDRIRHRCARMSDPCDYGYFGA
jgi:hypothetical protein